MHILFVHQNFPAQFGHIASELAKVHGVRCTFVSTRPGEDESGIMRLRYRPIGGAGRHTHYLSRTFENCIAHCHGVYEALKAHPEVQPDLIVGHSGFGSTLFLPELYECPIINYVEYYYHSHDSDIDYRPEFPTTELNTLRSRARNAMLLLDLQQCEAAYSPTAWQRSRIPNEYRDKVSTICDGIDTSFWRPGNKGGVNPRRVRNLAIERDTRVVTYVARGFESMRGFDIFMKVAKRICAERSDVVFVCVGSDRVYYGGDERWTQGRSFREWVLSQDDYDLSRFIFTGAVPPEELVQILQISDLHIYLTVPFVLSWSLFNALSCGCTILASDTAPVQEVITHERNGLLAQFSDIERLTSLALAVINEPEQYRHLARAGRECIESDYALAKTLPQLVAFYNRVRESFRPSKSRVRRPPPMHTRGE